MFHIQKGGRLLPAEAGQRSSCETPAQPASAALRYACLRAPATRSGAYRLPHPPAAPADAAKAFRELRVRPGRAPSPLRTGGGERDREQPREARERGGGLPERPPSPKKRKASYNIDKEFILKDDKVKRNTGAAGGGGLEWVDGTRLNKQPFFPSSLLPCSSCCAVLLARGTTVCLARLPPAADTQGDISQARGQLGQLLFEFSQVRSSCGLARSPVKCGWQVTVWKPDLVLGSNVAGLARVPVCCEHVACTAATTIAHPLLAEPAAAACAPICAPD